MKATRTANKQQVYSVYINKITTLHGITFFFVHFLVITVRLWAMKLPNFTCPLMELVNTTQMFVFLFRNLDTVLLYSTPENFANIWQIKWNWMRSMKFETVQIHFSSDVFSLLSFRNFATMATWRNDFFSLLSWELQLPRTCFYWQLHVWLV